MSNLCKLSASHYHSILNNNIFLPFLYIFLEFSAIIWGHST